MSLQKRLFPRRGAGECGCSPGAPGRGGALGWGEAQCWFRCQVCGADGVTCAWVCAHVCERAARQDRHPSVGGVPAEAGSVLTGLRACLPGAEGGRPGHQGRGPSPGQGSSAARPLPVGVGGRVQGRRGGRALEGGSPGAGLGGRREAEQRGCLGAPGVGVQVSAAGALCAPQARPTPVVSEPRRQGCKQASGRRENPAPSAPSPHRRRASRRNSGRRRGARGSLTEEGESGHRRTPPLPGRVEKKRLEPWGGPVLPHVRGVRRFLSLVALLWSVSLVTGDRCLPGGPLEQVPGSTL